ncbi:MULTISPECIES: EAL domain-containing protein [Paenibacillus]|uniref:EAL domain-containing protein n=1 Tax=Paenibacillus TaxID=44249 RepID=UPI0022B87C20|nr:EAL domain-containing protein [Paenibacillus caseinilyticus]MCZ8520586.1 EAL domain-containing protein [Paenibacillus caseinilyticus]
MSGTYHMYLVLLSFLVALMSSYSAFDLARRQGDVHGRLRGFYLCSAALIMGLGIWAMHFVAMLAYPLPVSVIYDTRLVVLSALFAVACSLGGFSFVGRPMPAFRKLAECGFLLLAGTSGMHFIGMAAMLMTGVQYLWLPLLLSALTGVVGMTGALLLGFRPSRKTGSISYLQRMGSSFCMAFAITSLHYLGLEAMTIAPSSHVHGAGPPQSPYLQDYMLGIILANCTIFFLSIIVIRGYFLDRRYREGDAVKLAMLQSAIDGILTIDSRGSIIECNPMIERIFGYSREELVCLEMADLLGLTPGIGGVAEDPAEYGRSGSTADPSVPEAVAFLLDRRMESTGWRADGSVFPVEISMTRTKGLGRPMFTAFIRDITDRKLAEERMRQSAFRDPLTGLPNRSHLQDKLTAAIGCSGGTQEMLGVMFLDLDGFKQINDTFGHDCGDMLLQEVARRLEACVREEDVVSRQGGDEFIIMLSGITPGTASRVAARMIEALARPFHYMGRDMSVTPSIGIAMYPTGGSSANSLVKHADAAMYQAKQNGKNHFQFYTEEMEASLQRQSKLQARLKLALERDEFMLHYAPVLSAKTGEMLAVEALLRWNRDGILLPAAEFISAAEESGLMTFIGQWVLREACRQHVRWEEMGVSSVPMSVNISAREFSEEGFLDSLRRILADTGMEPKRLQLELTEEVGHKADMSVWGRMEELKSMGLRLSLDDFGSGTASLRFLQQMPADELKLDRRLISSLGECPTRLGMVEALIGLAHRRGMQVVAEGVEAPDQLERLRELHCDSMQGYWFGQPMAAQDMERQLRYERLARKGDSLIS